MQRDDRVYLSHMLDMAYKSRSLVGETTQAGFESNEVLRLALRHLLQIIGEAANRVSDSGRAAHPQIPWAEIIGMRHRVVHDYLGIDEEVVWRTAIEDLPLLIAVLEQVLDDEEH
jgi:uncharacterized protein with HEPN domain